MAVNSMEIRVENRRRILETLLQDGPQTRQELQNRLHLSLPTVQQILKELTEQGILRAGSVQASSGGRRPTTVELDPDGRCAVGIQVFSNRVILVLLNLCGEIAAVEHYPVVELESYMDMDIALYTEEGMRRARERAEMMHTTEFFSHLAGSVAQFIETNCPKQEKLLGIGIGLGGQVTPERWVCDGISSDLGELLAPLRALGFPVACRNDARLGGMAEAWQQRLENVVCLTLETGVGGALIQNGTIFEGQTGHGTEFGHILLDRHGKRCTCGRVGCSGTQVQKGALLSEEHPSIGAFFDALRQGDASCEQKFRTYLDNLATLLITLDVTFDLDILICGEIAPWLEERQDELLAAIDRQNGPDNQLSGPLHFGTFGANGAAVGAALQFIHQFLRARE